MRLRMRGVDTGGGSGGDEQSPPSQIVPYEGGLNREHFLPFINMLEKYCVVHHMGSMRTWTKLFLCECEWKGCM